MEQSPTCIVKYKKQDCARLHNATNFVNNKIKVYFRGAENISKRIQ